MKVPIAAALLLVSIATHATIHGINQEELKPENKALLKQAQHELENLTSDERNSLVFTEEAQRCLYTAEDYAELEKGAPFDAFVTLASKYCFRGAKIAHNHSTHGLKTDWLEMGGEDVPANVLALLKHSEMRGITIGHELEDDAVKDRFFQLAYPQFGFHKFQWPQR